MCTVNLSVDVTFLLWVCGWLTAVTSGHRWWHYDTGPGEWPYPTSYRKRITPQDKFLAKLVTHFFFFFILFYIPYIYSHLLYIWYILNSIASYYCTYCCLFFTVNTVTVVVFAQSFKHCHFHLTVCPGCVGDKVLGLSVCVTLLAFSILCWQITGSCRA